MGLGLPSGNHGLFLRFAVPAVTLRGHTSRKSHTIAGYTELGRAIEGMARCLNNLLERFHQSFFFYLLPASHRYVSIGLYFGPFAAMAVPLVLR
jgi:glycosylphosphatidylinositol transamidase